MARRIIQVHAAIFVALLTACAPLAPLPAPSSAGVGKSEGKRIFITDRFGDRFDITYAVEKYGMSRYGFEYGIGKNTIRPINQPSMIGREDDGFPWTGDNSPVIGTVIEGDVRSYPIRPLASHEIVNEIIGGTPAAVAY